MKTWKTLAVLSILSIAGAWETSAQTPLGPEFRVDRADIIPYARYAPGVAFDFQGDLWITWESQPTGEERFRGLAARSFSPSGLPSRPVLVIPGNVQVPLLVPTGREFAVFGQDTNQPGIVVRRLSPEGRPLRHTVAVQKTSLATPAAAAAVPGAGFFLIWPGDDCPGRCESPGVFARVLDPFGRPVTRAFRVSQTFRGLQLPTGVVAGPDGSVFVTWWSQVEDSLDYAVFARRFSRQGIPLSGEFRVSVQSPGGEGGMAADAQGNFIVTWTTRRKDSNRTEIYARRYARNGTPLGPEFRVSQEEAAADVYSKVAMSPQGDAFIVWSSFDCAECDYVDVKGRLLRADGTAEDEILINQYRGGIQSEASVAFAADGRIAVAWLGESNSHYEYEITARLFTVAP